MPRRSPLAAIMSRRDLHSTAKLVYWALRRNSAVHINEVCQATGLPRSSCYLAFRQLAKKKLVYGPERGFVVRL
jgi:hypothetical protein